MSVRTVPLANAGNSARGVMRVEDGATLGATVGVNLVLQDGTVVTAEMILNDTDEGDDEDFSWTYWRLLLEIPPNIVAIAALTGGGWAFMDSVGVWRVRRLGRQVFAFTFGDATPSPIWQIPHDLEAVLVTVVVRTPFNGTDPGIELGTAADPDLLLPASAVDLSVAGAYEFNPGVEMATGEDVVVTITPGSGGSAGSGKIIVDTIPLEGI